MPRFTPERMVSKSQNTIQVSYLSITSDRHFRRNRTLSQHLRSCRSKNVNSIVHDAVTATDENIPLVGTPEVRYKLGRYGSYQFEEHI